MFKFRSKKKQSGCSYSLFKIFVLKEYHVRRNMQTDNAAKGLSAAKMNVLHLWFSIQIKTIWDLCGGSFLCCCVSQVLLQHHLSVFIVACILSMYNTELR